MDIYKVLTQEVLRSSAYWTLNKTVVQLVGVESAIILSSFADAEAMMADEAGWFYQTSETVEKQTTLSRHKQNTALANLEKKGLIEKELRGMPAKRYFRINHARLANKIAEFQQTRLPNISKQDCRISATNKERNNKERNNKDIVHEPKTVQASDTSRSDKKKEIDEFFESVWKLYPKKRGKDQVGNPKRKELYKAGVEEVKKAITNYKEEVKRLKLEDKYILNGSTFFNGRWKDYTKENYIPLKTDEDFKTEPVYNAGIYKPL